MKRPQRPDYSLYTDDTIPVLPTQLRLPPVEEQTSWMGRFFRGIALFFSAVICKINQILALLLAVLLLLLFTRFLLTFFHLSLSDFSSWVFFASTPLVAPFQQLLPALPYSGYLIDVSTLVAIVVYALVGTIVRQFLKIFVIK